jgi:hypothetical protein
MDEEWLNWVPFVLTAGAIGFLCVSCISYFLGRTEKVHYGNRQTETAMVSSDTVREVMRELDPVDSLYFDVSVARHSLEEGDLEKAKVWLDGSHALGELHRSIRLGLISPAEGDEISKEIGEIVRLIEERKLVEALNALIKLQAKAGEIAYSAIAIKFKEKGLDPPQRIDARFEPLRTKKIEEWKAKGYSPGLIEKALLWAEDWARGIARRFIRDPELAARVAETIYPEALELSERYIQAFARS